MNVWIFSGNLGADAELRYTTTGAAVSNFRVGIKAGFGDRAHTVWAQVSLWGKSAEGLTPHLIKGQRVEVMGEVHEREWADKDGNKRKSFEVHASRVELAGARPGGAPAKADDDRAPEMADDDIPF
jgi:single-strand DNA-binding protein